MEASQTSKSVLPQPAPSQNEEGSECQAEIRKLLFSSNSWRLGSFFDQHPEGVATFFKIIKAFDYDEPNLCDIAISINNGIQSLSKSQIVQHKEDLYEIAIAGDQPSRVRSQALYQLGMEGRVVEPDKLLGILKNSSIPDSVRFQAAEILLYRGQPRDQIKLYHLAADENFDRNLKFEILTTGSSIPKIARRILEKNLEQIATPQISPYDFEKLRKAVLVPNYRKHKAVISAIAENRRFNSEVRLECAKLQYYLNPEAARQSFFNIAKVFRKDPSECGSFLRGALAFNDNRFEDLAVRNLERYKQSKSNRDQASGAMASIEYLIKFNPNLAAKYGKELLPDSIKLANGYQRFVGLLEVCCKGMFSVKQVRVPKMLERALLSVFTQASVEIVSKIPDKFLKKYSDELFNKINDGKRNSEISPATHIWRLFQLNGYLPKYYKLLKDNFENHSYRTTEFQELICQTLSLRGSELPSDLQSLILKPKISKNCDKRFAFNEYARISLITSIMQNLTPRNLARIDAIMNGEFGWEMKQETLNCMLRLEDQFAIAKATKAAHGNINSLEALAGINNIVARNAVLRSLLSSSLERSSIAASAINSTWNKAEIESIPEQIKNLLPYLSSAKQRVAEKYIDAAARAQVLNISNIHRYGAFDLEEIVNVREGAIPFDDRPIVFIATPKSDHNGAFSGSSFRSMASELSAVGFQFVVYEIDGTDQLLEAKQDFLNLTKGRQADHVILMAHGTDESMGFGKDPERIDAFKDRSHSMHVSHFEYLRDSNFAEILVEDGSIMTVACAVGNGRGEHEGNFINMLRRLFPQATYKGISGMEISAYFNGIDFNWRKQSITGHYGDILEFGKMQMLKPAPAYAA